MALSFLFMGLTTAHHSEFGGTMASDQHLRAPVRLQPSTTSLSFLPRAATQTVHLPYRACGNLLLVAATMAVTPPSLPYLTAFLHRLAGGAIAASLTAPVPAISARVGLLSPIFPLGPTMEILPEPNPHPNLRIRILHPNLAGVDVETYAAASPTANARRQQQPKIRVWLGKANTRA